MLFYELSGCGFESCCYHLNIIAIERTIRLIISKVYKKKTDYDYDPKENCITLVNIFRNEKLLQ